MSFENVFYLLEEQIDLDKLQKFLWVLIVFGDIA